MCAKLSAAGCDGLECLRSAPYHRPEDVLRAVQQLNPAFQGYAQQDAQEFLRCVLDNIHEELRREVPGAQRLRVSKKSRVCEEGGSGGL